MDSEVQADVKGVLRFAAAIDERVQVSLVAWPGLC